MSTDIKELLTERGKIHGNAIQQFSFAQSLKKLCRDHWKWNELPLHMREVIEMDLLKISRILCGDHMEPDHWRDIIGYTQLVLTELESYAQDKTST